MAVIHNNLKELRVSLKLTQQQFSDELNIKRSSIGAYEEGRATPPLDLLIQICDKYGLSLDNLCRDKTQAVNINDRVCLLENDISKIKVFLWGNKRVSLDGIHN